MNKIKALISFILLERNWEFAPPLENKLHEE